MQLDNVLEDIFSLNSNAIFLGDFNIHYNASNETRAHHIENNFQLKQLIKGWTPETDKSKFSIDLIFTNTPFYHSRSGVVSLSLSDHYATFTQLNLKSTNQTKKSVFH